MKNKWFQRTVRYFLTLLLIYGVFTETGIWTAVCIFSMFIRAETEQFINAAFENLYKAIGKP